MLIIGPSSNHGPAWGPSKASHFNLLQTPGFPSISGGVPDFPSGISSFNIIVRTPFRNLYSGMSHESLDLPGSSFSHSWQGTGERHRRAFGCQGASVPLRHGFRASDGKRVWSDGMGSASHVENLRTGGNRTSDRTTAWDPIDWTDWS